MAIEEIKGLADINSGDKVFRNIDTGFIGKVRLKKRAPVDGADALCISISKADVAGKAALRNPAAARADALTVIAKGEPPAAHFVVGPETTISMHFINESRTQISPTADLLAVIEARLIEMELFSNAQAEAETLYTDWGL